MLGSWSEVILPDSKVITGLRREFFQSSTFQRAGYQYIPERYGTFDRLLTTVDFADRSQALLVSGKISSGRPFEVSHAADAGAYPGGGHDTRGMHTVYYEYDGKGTITETDLSSKEARQHTGETGKPDVLLYWIRESLGEQVETETFILAKR